MRYFLLSLGLWMGLSGQALAQKGPDYSLSREPWNGIGELGAIAKEAGVNLLHSEVFNPLEHPVGRGLLVLYPAYPPDLDALTHVLSQGSTVIWLDDFGQSGPLWHALGIERHLPETPLGVFKLEVGPQSHRLLSHLEELWLNHPVALRAPKAKTRLVPLKQPNSDETLGHLIVEVTVGTGTFIAIGDPSTLINELTRAHTGNRQFATNVLHASCSKTPCEVTLLGPQSQVLSLAAAQEAKRLTRVLDQAISRVERHLPPSQQERLLILLCLLLSASALLALYARWPRLHLGAHHAFVGPIQHAQRRWSLIKHPRADLSSLLLPLARHGLELTRHPAIRQRLLQSSGVSSETQAQQQLREALVRIEEAHAALTQPYRAPWYAKQALSLAADVRLLTRYLPQGSPHVHFD